MAGQTINVSILADTKKFSSAMRNLSQQSGLDKLGSKFQSAGRKIGTFMKNTAKGAALAAAGIAALALKGGFERALNIEDAQAQLKALGHDTKSIDSIMQNALASVKGTAFGLGDAATLAGQAVAAGIKPGEDLERQLKLVTNTAALAKVGMGEMGSIFTKVWTRGRADTEVLNQVAERGIPIWTELAEHYGVTGSELQKMVSAGKVDAETFATVMEDTVGNAALEMGDTTRGAWANMMAALSRAGESFLKEIFPKFKTGLTGITGFLDRLTPFAERAGAAVGDFLGRVTAGVQGLYDLIVSGDFTGALHDAFGWEEDSAVVGFLLNLRERSIEVADTFTTRVVPALQQLGDFIQSKVMPALASLASWFIDNRDRIAAVAVVVAAFLAGMQGMLKLQAAVLALQALRAAVVALNTAMLANPAVLIAGAIAALAAGLVLFFTQTEIGRQIWANAWAGIQAATQVVVDWFAATALPLLQAAWAAIQVAGQFVVDWFTATALPALQAAWTGIQAAATVAADWFMTYVAPIFTASGELVVAIFQRLGEIWGAVWAQMQGAWDSIGGPVLAAIGIAVGILQGIWSVAWENIKTVLAAAWAVIRTTVETALQAVAGIIRAVTAAINGDWSGAWEEIKGVLSTIWEGMKANVDTVANALLSIISSILTSIKDAWRRAWDDVKAKVSAAWDAIKSTTERKIGEVLAFFQNMPSQILGALGDLSGLLSGAAQDVIDGFISGIRAKFADVKAELGRLTSLIPSWKGPAARDKTLLRGAGNLIIDGFVSGLEERYGAVRNSLQGLSQDVASTPFQSLDTAPTVSRAAQQQRAHEQALSADRETAVNSRLTELATALQSIPGRIESVVEMDSRVVARGTRKGNEQLGDRTQWSQGPQLGRRAY